MTTAKKLPMTAWVFLDSEINPTGDAELAAVPEDRIRGACGIIPDFFLVAVLEGMDTASRPSVGNVSERMDEAYQFGGFSCPLHGTLSPQGVYHSPFEEQGDEPLAPLARFAYGNLELFVYRYAITALRDRSTGEFKVGRFD